WPSKIPPLSGTEYRKLSPKSNAACHPTASHNEPVRRKVNAHSKPVKNILVTPNQFSPLLVRWTRAKIADSAKAAGQKPITSANVCCRYPRKRNSSGNAIKIAAVNKSQHHCKICEPAKASTPYESHGKADIEMTTKL